MDSPHVISIVRHNKINIASGREFFSQLVPEAAPAYGVFAAGYLLSAPLAQNRTIAFVDYYHYNLSLPI